MIEQALKEQISSIFANIEADYILKVEITPSHPNRVELLELLNDLASCSDKISVEEKEGDSLFFAISKDGEVSSFSFKAVPNGHEFSSLLLAIINLDGKGKNLPDTAIIDRIKNLKGTIEITTYISLTCTNCPDVVQALNLISILNPDVRHTIVDGALFKEKVEKLGIQAVPAVYLDDKSFHIGKATIAELLNKLEEQMGSNMQYEAKELNFDVIVAGGGPAGATAAIYSARKGFKVALVTDRIGGQVLETQDIENITSLSSITGTQYAANILDHIKQYPVEILSNRKIKSVEKRDTKNVLKTSMNEEIIAPVLIIATGASWRKLNVEGESDYIGRGVAFCTHCDGPFYKGKKVVVVGGGNSGLEAAIDLSSIATEVTIVEFLEELKGDKVLQDKIATLSNVKVILNAQTTEVIGNGDKVVAIHYKDRASKEIHTIDCDGIFVQIGLLPNSQEFKDVVSLTNRGEIEIDASCRTSTIGIYAAGDVTTVPYKQVVIAVGEGAKAALSVFEDNIKDII